MELLNSRIAKDSSFVPRREGIMLPFEGVELLASTSSIKKQLFYPHNHHCI